MSRAQLNYFDNFALAYSRLFSEKKSGAAFSFSSRLNIASTLGTGRSGKFLDMAVGSGEVTKAVLMSGNFTYATLNDISPAMLELAKSKLESISGAHISWHQGDCFAFLQGLPAGEFDFLLCTGLIAHTVRLEELLGLLRRAVSPQGAILFQSTLAEHWGVRFHRMMIAKSYEKRFGYSISYQTTRKIKEAAYQQGLLVADLKRYCLFVPGLDKVAPVPNFYLETAFASLARKVGSEGLFLLVPAN
jgi:ubiquinone/menaquinone biosynthesis C-methylase UbiE